MAETPISEGDDPLEPFEGVEDYDLETETMRIAIHMDILRRPRQQAALARKLAEVMERWPGIRKIEVVPR